MSCCYSSARLLIVRSSIAIASSLSCKDGHCRIPTMRCRSTELFWKGLAASHVFRHTKQRRCFLHSNICNDCTFKFDMYLPRCSFDVFRLTSYLKIIHPGGLATMQPCFLTDCCEIPYTWKILRQRTPFGSHPVTHSDIERLGSCRHPARLASKKPQLHHLHHQAHCTSPRADVPCR